MQWLKTITDSDFVGGEPEFMEVVSRYASRGVLINDELKVAMMEMSGASLYKLPGGGVEEGEERAAAFLREIKEETGYDAVIIEAIGYIDEHKNRNQFMQRSYCYMAKATKQPGNTALTEEETQLGMRVKWMSLEEAVAQLRNLIDRCEDYSTSFMLLRDLTILEHASRLLDNGTVHNVAEEYIWAIFVADQAGVFPNFYPIGLYTCRDRAVAELGALPRDMNYQLLKLPVNRMFPYYHKKSGKLVGMDGVDHEHFHFRDDM